MILRAKSVWCLLLLLAATPIASAQVAGFQAFDAYASGPATAIFDLTPFAGPELHVIDVNIALHRNSPSGAVMDNGATGSIILHDRTRGTDVARMTIDSAFLFDAGGGHQGLIVEGVAKVQHDPDVNDNNLPGYTLQLIQGGSPNFLIDVFDPTFVLSYSATLPTVTITPR